jgi:hypothetical protein
MEQRHHAEGDVGGRQRVMSHDVPRGCSDIPMQDRHALRASSASAGVKNKGDIVWRRRSRRLSARRTRDPHESSAVHLQRKNWNALSLGCFPGVSRSVRGAKEDLGGRVLEEEAEFVLSVSGIEGSGRSSHRGCQKTDDGRQPVRQHCGDAVASLNAERGQSIRHRRDLISQRTVSNTNSHFGKNDRGAVPGRNMNEFQ